MSRPGLFEGIAVALLGGLGASIVVTVMDGPMGFEAALNAAAGGLGTAYGFYLIGRARVRSGRVLLATAWPLVTAGLLAAAVHPVAHILIQLLLVWGARCWCFHRTLQAAGYDLAIGGSSFMAMLWAAAHTGSIGVSVWCLMLVQAMFVFIPAPGRWPPAETPPARGDGRFERARTSAEEALQKLARTH